MLFCVAVQFGQIYPNWLVFSCLKNKKKITLKKQKDYLKDYLKDFSTDGNKSDSLECERFVLSPSKFSLLLRRLFFFFLSYPDKSTRFEKRSIWCARTLSRGGVGGCCDVYFCWWCLQPSMPSSLFGLKKFIFGSTRAASYQQLRSHHAGTNLITHALLMNSLWALINKKKKKKK